MDWYTVKAYMKGWLKLAAVGLIATAMILLIIATLLKL